MSDCSTLEDLPNEIFHELFEYFDINELYHTFARSNRRIDSLIENVRSLQMILHSPDDLDQPINRYFLPKIKTLVVDHSKQFFDPLQCTLPSIRCLILCKPARLQWNSIQPNFFPSLQRLHLLNSAFAYRTEQLCQLIFSNQFPSLHTCSLPFVAYQENNQWISSPVLQSVYICLWDIRVYRQVLDACPDLRRLTVEITGGSNQEQLPLTDADKQHPVLQSLSLRSTKAITCEFLDSLLFFVPHLGKFSLRVISQRTSYVPTNTLASIFQDRIPKLSRLKIDVTVPESLCSLAKIKTKYPLFKSCRIQPDLIRPSRLIIVGSI